MIEEFNVQAAVYAILTAIGIVVPPVVILLKNFWFDGLVCHRPLCFRKWTASCSRCYYNEMCDKHTIEYRIENRIRAGCSDCMKPVRMSKYPRKID